MEEIETVEDQKKVKTAWRSYPKSQNLGHRTLAELLNDPVVVEEKIDGSQFSFGLFDGELRCRSKSAVLNLTAPEKMFLRAIESVQKMAPLLRDGWTYRGEYLLKPKHNVLAYERIPQGHIIGFDISTGPVDYMSYADKVAEFARIGLETVPCIYEGVLSNYETCRDMLSRISILGGQKIEGIVIKNRYKLNSDGKMLMAKFVSEEFKEVHTNTWREGTVEKKDIIEVLTSDYKTPARWSKSVQRLREAGQLKESPEDIGALIKEVAMDIESECSEEIKEKLWAWAWDKVRRGVTGGLPQWYKEQLMKSQFEGEVEEGVEK
jgi:hypothetical protein